VGSSLPGHQNGAKGRGGTISNSSGRLVAKAHEPISILSACLDRRWRRCRGRTVLGSLRARNRAIVSRDKRSHDGWQTKTGESEKRGRRASCSSFHLLSQHRGFHQVGSGTRASGPVLYHRRTARCGGRPLASIVLATDCGQQDAVEGLWRAGEANMAAEDSLGAKGSQFALYRHGDVAAS
jgi:hypothetical protein